MAMVFALAFPGVALAAEGDGVIDGQVINGTDGGSSVAGLDVTLERYLDGELHDSQLVATGEDGRFVVEGVPTGSGYFYRASLFYQDAEYFSDYAFFEEGETVAYTGVVVFDATTNGGAISVTSSHTIMRVEGNGLRVAELYVFNNDSDLTYVGEVEVGEGQYVTLSFPLPEDASALELDTGLMECCIYGSDGGFVHTMPVLPGETQVLFRYNVPYSGDSYTLDRGVYYPTAGYDLFVEGVGIEIESSSLAVSTSTTESGVSWTFGSATDLSPGDTLLAEVLGLPRIGGDMTIVIVAVTLVVLIGGVIAYILRRKKSETTAGVVAVAGNAEDERQRLLVLIAGFDDDFESGKLAEDTYRRRRDAAKAELQRLLERTG